MFRILDALDQFIPRLHLMYLHHIYSDHIIDLIYTNKLNTCNFTYIILKRLTQNIENFYWIINKKAYIRANNLPKPYKDYINCIAPVKNRAVKWCIYSVSKLNFWHPWQVATNPCKILLKLDQGTPMNIFLVDFEPYWTNLDKLDHSVYFDLSIWTCLFGPDSLHLSI